MGIENIAGILSTLKALNLTDDQKKSIKEAVKNASGNKDAILNELKKHGVSVTEGQVDAVLGLIDKL